MVEYRNFPLVLKTDGINPIGIAESSSIGTLYVSSLVVCSVYADTYQNLVGGFNFTGIYTVTSVGSGTPIVDNSDPNNPKFRAFSVTTDGFVTINPHPGLNPGLDIQFGGNALGPERGGTGYDSPGGEGEIPAWTGGQLQPRPGFTFNSNILDLPLGGEYHINGSQIGLNNLADINVASPDTNEVLTWDGGSWVNLPPLTGAGTTVSLPTTPGRIPYTIDTTSLGSVPWFNVDTGSGRVNVCSVCAVGSVCATTFVEGGQSLSVKYLTKAVADTYYQACDVFLNELATNNSVDLENDVANTLQVGNGGTGLTSLSPTGALLYVGGIDNISLTVSPTPNNYLKWNGTAYTWDIPATGTGTGTNIPNQPGRIPYIINATSLGSESWFNIETGTGRVNVCSVCAVGSVCATTFVEGGQSLSVKYLTKAVADTYYQACDVILNDLVSDGFLPVTRGGTGFTSLSPTGSLLYAGGPTTVSLTPAPSTNTYLKWDGGAFAWDVPPVGTGVNIPNQPGRIPYIIDATSLGSESWFTITTGTGAFNVCSVCAVGNVCAANFVESGTTLTSKYLTQVTAAATYHTIAGFSTFTGTLKQLAFADRVFLDTTSVTGSLTVQNGGTGQTSLAAGSFIVGNGTTAVSLIPTGSFETTSYSRANFATIASLNNYVLTSTYSTFTGTLGDLAFLDQVNLTTTSVTGTLSISKGGTGATTLGGGLQILYVESGGASINNGGYFDGTTLGAVNLATTSLSLIGNQLNHNLKIDLATTSVTGSLTVQNGGTGQTSLTAGSFIIGNGTTAVSLIPTGSFETTSYSRANFATIASLNNYVLTSTYSTFTGTLGELAFIDQVNLTTTSVTGTLTVSRGGTGLTSLTPTGLLYAANSTTVTQTPAPSTNTYLKWNGTAFAWDTPGASLPTTPDADLFLSSLSPDKDPYTDGGVYVWIGGAGNATLLGPPDPFQNYVVKFTANGGIKWEPTTEGAFTLAPPQLLYTSANYFSALIVDSLSSVDHFNENSTMFYAEATTLNAGTISATTYLNLPSSTVVWASATNATNATNAVNAQIVRKYVKNSTGATIPKGRPVTVVGAVGDNSLIAPLSSVNTHVPEAIGLSNHVFGLTETQILDNDFGYIITEGIVSGTGGGVNALDTSLFAAGDILYVSSNGLLTNTRPNPPYESHPVGFVIRSQANNGSIYVKIETQPEINDIVGFNLASSILNGDLISYDLTTSTFVNTQSINLSGSIKGGSLSATNLSATNARITSLSATTVSATTYQNLPTAALSGLSDVLITSPATSSVLKWNGTKWVPATDQTGGGGAAAAGTVAGAIQFNDGVNGFDANDDFYYASKNLYINVGTAGQLNTDTVVAQDIQATQQLSVDSVALTSPAAGALLVNSSLRSPTVSATTYLNLPSGVATWNANKLQGVDISTATPKTEDTLVYNGTAWAPKSVIAISNVIGNNLISS